MVNPVVAQKIYMMLGLCYQYQIKFIHQFNNLYIGKTWINSCTFLEIFVQM